MARNRKNQPAAIRFGPALRAFLLCLIIGGSGVGYVWQKTQIDELGRDIRRRETHLTELRESNQKLRDQLAWLRLPKNLKERIGPHPRGLDLGLVEPQPAQIWRLAEPLGIQPVNRKPVALYAAQPVRGSQKQ
jgi:hypothetical protein